MFAVENLPFILATWPVSAHVSLTSPAYPQLRERATCPLALKPLQEVCRPQSCKLEKAQCLSDPELRGVVEPQRP